MSLLQQTDLWQPTLNSLLVVSRYVLLSAMILLALSALVCWMANRGLKRLCGDCLTLSSPKRESLVRTGQLLTQTGSKLLVSNLVWLFVTTLLYAITFFIQKLATNY